MNIPTHAVGFDPGNSETCTVMMDRDKSATSLTIPSETALGELRRLKSLDIKMRPASFVYRDESIELFIGDLAIEQARNPFGGRGDPSRYYSDTALQLLLTTTAALTPAEPEMALTVVTGIPVETYIDNPDTRRDIKRKLAGTYQFYLNDIPRTTHITVRAIAMEGAGAMSKYGMQGKVRQGVIDIGGKTTDLFVAQGQEPIQALCASIPLGVETAYDQLNAQFEALYRRPLDRTELRGILHAYVHGHNPSPIYVDGSPVVNVMELARKAVYKVGNDITSRITDKWKDNLSGKVAGSFARALLIGGGAYYFHTPVQRQIANIAIPQSPETANAAGYADIAYVYMMRDLANEQRDEA